VAAGSNLQSPALLIVGEVVSLHGRLAWFNGEAPAVPAEVPQSA
jgi:hypothetical protein